MKKLMALLLVGAMSISMMACGSKDEVAGSDTENTSEDTESAEGDGEIATDITLWTYPVGGFQDSETVEGFIESFNEKYPDINVSVKYLDYTSGDEKVEEAIEKGTTPDIILEGPERLVSNWGAQGKMVDLSDLWDEEATADISATSQAVVDACRSADGIFYEYPLCMTTHTMVINYELFEAADALQYINEDRTWSTENFEKALKALKSYGVETPGIVYCSDQSGDQGTRALAMNLYSAKFTNTDHTEWTMNSENGVKGLQQLADWVNTGLLSSGSELDAAGEIRMFADEKSAMSFCWNAANQLSYASHVDFTPYAVAFPSDDSVPELCGGIWGFGIFDNGDAGKIAAAKLFIEFICDDKVQGPISVTSTGFFPVRSSYGNTYAGTADEERMEVYASFHQWLGDYYIVTPGWSDQRTAWWNLLQQIFAGEDVQTAADAYAETGNAATADAYESLQIKTK